MPNAEDDDLDTPELNAEWFRTAIQPHRFESEAELEEALRAMEQAAERQRQRR